MNLVSLLDKELRRRGERGRIYIGLDGYSHADMSILPELIRELNVTKFRGGASPTRLPLDVSSNVTYVTYVTCVTCVTYVTS